MSIKKLLANSLIDQLENIDWGRTIAPFNEMVVKELFHGEQIEHVSGITSGYNFSINDQRVQCKLRQVTGDTPFSKSVYLSTTRRHSIKKNHKGSTGQICYSSDEFDYVFVTLVHNGHRNINDWYASLIPVTELEDVKKGNLKTSISSKLLKKYELVDFFKTY